MRCPSAATNHAQLYLNRSSRAIDSESAPFLFGDSQSFCNFYASNWILMLDFSSGSDDPKTLVSFCLRFAKMNQIWKLLSTWLFRTFSFQATAKQCAIWCLAKVHALSNFMVFGPKIGYFSDWAMSLSYPCCDFHLSFSHTNQVKTLWSDLDALFAELLCFSSLTHLSWSFQ